MILAIIAVLMIPAIIAGLIDSDGECHEKTCGKCPYYGTCPQQEETDNDE